MQIIINIYIIEKFPKNDEIDGYLNQVKKNIETRS